MIIYLSSLNRFNSGLDTEASSELLIELRERERAFVLVSDAEILLRFDPISSFLALLFQRVTFSWSNEGLKLSTCHFRAQSDALMLVFERLSDEIV